MDATTLMLSMLFGALGMGYLVFAKKAGRIAPALAGAGLMIVPYFISSILLMVIACLALVHRVMLQRPIDLVGRIPDGGAIRTAIPQLREQIERRRLPDDSPFHACPSSFQSSAKGRPPVSLRIVFNSSDVCGHCASAI